MNAFANTLFPSKYQSSGGDIEHATRYILLILFFFQRVPQLFVLALSAAALLAVVDSSRFPARVTAGTDEVNKTRGIKFLALKN